MASYYGNFDVTFKIGTKKRVIKKFYQYVESFMKEVEPIWKVYTDKSECNSYSWLMGFSEEDKARVLEQIAAGGDVILGEGETVVPETIDTFERFLGGLVKEVPEVTFEGTLDFGSYCEDEEYEVTFLSMSRGRYVTLFDNGRYQIRPS